MAKKKANKQLIYVVMAALFAAIITVVTAYVLHIPTGNGYIHLGDSFIFLAASLLPLPYAIAAAAVGAGLADALTAPIWVIATVIIKSLIVLPFTSKKDKIIFALAVFSAGPHLCVNGFLALIIATVTRVYYSPIHYAASSSLMGGSDSKRSFSKYFAIISYFSSIFSPLNINKIHYIQLKLG